MSHKIKVTSTTISSHYILAQEKHEVFGINYVTRDSLENKHNFATGPNCPLWLSTVVNEYVSSRYFMIKFCHLLAGVRLIII